MRKILCTVKSVSAVILLVAIAGCRSAPSWPWTIEHGKCGGVECSDPVSAFVTASQFCRKVHNYYEAGGTWAGYGKASLGIAGAVAGSVIAPVTHGSSTKAWAGLAGSTSAMQAYMDEALSTSIALKRQTAIAAAMKTGYAAMAQASSSEAKVLAAMSMTNACWLASSEADQAALGALVAPTPASQASAPGR